MRYRATKSLGLLYSAAVAIIAWHLGADGLELRRAYCQSQPADQQPTGVGFGVDEKLHTLLKERRFVEAEDYVTKQEKPEPGIIGWLNLKQGKIDEGLKLLKADLNDMPDAANTLRTLTIVEDASPKEALALCDELLSTEAYRDDPFLKLRLIELLLKVNEPDRAMKTADAVLATDFADAALKQPLFKLSAYLYTNERVTDAIRYADALFAKWPETRLEPGFLMQSIHYNTRAGNPLGSLKRLDALERDHPNYSKENAGLFLLAKAQAFEALGDWHEAERQLKALKQVAEKDPAMRGAKAMYDAKLEEYANRNAAIERAKAAAVDNSTPTRATPPKPTSMLTIVIVTNILVISGIGILLCWRYRISVRTAHPINESH